LPESTLRKRHVNIAYHMCREQVAAGVLLPIKVHTGDNLADTGSSGFIFQPTSGFSPTGGTWL